MVFLTFTSQGARVDLACHENNFQDIFLLTDIDKHSLCNETKQGSGLGDSGLFFGLPK
jgi:hypothetical protein